MIDYKEVRLDVIAICNGFLYEKNTIETRKIIAGHLNDYFRMKELDITGTWEDYTRINQADKNQLFLGLRCADGQVRSLYEWEDWMKKVKA